MIKSEEHKLDKLEEELQNIEKFAKNLDINSKDEYHMVLTNIVSEKQNVSDDHNKNNLIQYLNDIKINLSKQIKQIDNIIKNFDR